MDSGTKLIQPNPKKRANCFSKLLFLWTVKPLWHILKYNVHVAELPELLDSDQSEKVADKLEENWKRQMHKAKSKNQKANLLKAIIETFYKEYMVYGAILFIQHVLLRAALPLILAKIISLFNIKNYDMQSMLIYSSLLIFLNIIIIGSMHHTNFGQGSIGMRLRTAISSLIYRKSLRLSKSSLAVTSTGEIVNLLSNDVIRFDMVPLTLHYLWLLPFQTALITFLSYQEVGNASFVGIIAIALLSLPLQGYLGKVTSRFRRRMADKTDKRVTLMGEIISGIRTLKIYGWEAPFSSFLQKIRQQEVVYLKWMSNFRGIYISFMIFVERAAVFLTLTFYFLSGNMFSAEQVFSLAQFFNLLQLTMSVFYPLAISYGAESLVSIRRIEKFLLMEENDEITQNQIIGPSSDIILEHVTAAYLPTKPVLKDLSLKIPLGSLCAIIGPVGSGKTTFLHLLLKELKPNSGNVVFNGSISYASQEPWLFGATIRHNILFGQEYEKAFYNKVTKVCTLDRDFGQFPMRDRTFVGDRGATLSGGQKARINLARCVYKNADFYLMDDPLSAVDVKVGRHLFEKCILEFLKTKTRILVTHRVEYLKKADLIIALKDGKVEAMGTYQQLAEKTGLEFLKHEENDEKEEKKALVSSDSFIVDSADCQSEHSQDEETGIRKGSQTLLLYIKAAKANFFVFLVGFLMLVCQLNCSGIDYFVALLTRTKDFDLREYLENYTFLYIYSGLTVSLIIITFIRSMLFIRLGTRISRNLHNQMFECILFTPISFFNNNSLGRILNRFSKDLGAVDDQLPKVLLEATQIILILFSVCIMVVLSNYYMIIPTIILGLVFIKLRYCYVTLVKLLKHLEGIVKSPLFSHQTSSLNGITTIRAFNSEKILQKEFDNLQDIHTSVWFLLLSTLFSFGLWIDLLCVLFIACTTFGFVILSQYVEVDGSLVGLAISQSMILTGLLQYGVRQSAEVVNQMTSVERILQYTELEKEETIDEITLPPSWPTSGFILIENLFLFYSLEKPPTLQNINLEIQSGEKVGIVGRTGAGKSSLISALFRLTPTTGAIYIDGVDINKISLSELRRKISIIPQEPVLFSTTIRNNLDPFGEFTDSEIWHALEEVGMKEIVENLDGVVIRGGMDFSVGERQLICLARAVLRNNKILVMDEATSNTDDRTDALIQKMIRKKFKTCTVLTVAHRLHTVMDSDKIMLLDHGKVLEFDHPYTLLQKSDSDFGKMVDECGPKIGKRMRKVALDAYLQKS